MLYVARNKKTKELLLVQHGEVMPTVLTVLVWTSIESATPFFKAMKYEGEFEMEPLDIDDWRQLKDSKRPDWAQVFLHLMETNGVPHGVEV